jgi:ankyrin repeat protein
MSLGRRQVLMTLGALGALSLAGAVCAGAEADNASAKAAAELFEAARLDHGRSITTLLLRGADPNPRDAQHNTPLHIALREESEGALRALLQHPGTDVGAINQAGETPLMLAALKGRLAWAKLLVERGAPVNEPGWNALHYAAAGPEPKLVSWLLDRGARVDARSPNGTTALMMAAGYGGITSAELLLKAGADARLRNEPGLDAAEFARKAGRDELAAQLQRAARADRP